VGIDASVTDLEIPMLIRSLLIAALLLAVTACTSATQPTATTPAAPDGWQLVWSDEFNIDGKPDPSKWQHEIGFIRNHELQYYTDRSQNVRVENGRLIIEAHREAFANPKYEAGSEDWRKARQTAEYTSASLSTQATQHWRYGRIEVRAKLPGARGTWPAAWMLGENIWKVGWPECGEIDIMEHVGHKPGVIHAHVHTEAYNHVQGNGKGDSIEVDKPHERFYVYAVQWYPTHMDFFVDDRKYFTFRNEGTGEAAWPFDQPHFLILNLAIGGGWGGQQGIDTDAFPQRYEIDYVRVYQQTD
jgi:beta-glucanase (GH16 family)